MGNNGELYRVVRDRRNRLWGRREEADVWSLLGRGNRYTYSKLNAEWGPLIPILDLKQRPVVLCVRDLTAMHLDKELRVGNTLGKLKYFSAEAISDPDYVGDRKIIVLLDESSADERRGFSAGKWEGYPVVGFNTPCDVLS